jgi:LPS sulfotransferase NodH
VSELDVVFVVGAPRSGTTWLQHLLGSHPKIASPQETDLFDRYVGPWLRTWRAQLESAQPEPGRRQRGLPSVLTEEQFVALLRDVVEQVYGAVLELKPGAAVVLDKNPYHTYHLEDALRLEPAGGVVHVVRDGRDVACSLMRAAPRAWGREWAPTHVDGAAALWREFVENARKARSLTDRYVEVRYERLLSDDAARVLTELYDFCGVDADEHLAASALQRFDAARVQALPEGERPSGIVWGGEVVARGESPEEPDGFVGAAVAGAWREQLGPYERWLFDRVAGHLLLELGYELDRGWIGLGAPSRALARSRHLAARTSYGLRRGLRPARE